MYCKLKNKCDLTGLAERLTLYSLPNQLLERACKMSTNQDIFPTQHNTPAFSFTFIQPDLWAGLWDTCFAWEVKFIVKIHARIQAVFLNGSPLNISRDCLSPKNKLRCLAPPWPLGFKFGNHIHIFRDQNLRNRCIVLRLLHQNQPIDQHYIIERLVMLRSKSRTKCRVNF